MSQTGSCLCGAVTFETSAALRPVVACHCSQCRKTSGHYWAATQVPNEALTITKDAGLTWFQSSDWAERGFCNRCGSSLFYRMHGEGSTSIAGGALEGETGLTTAKHIFVKDKGDYYEIEHGPEQIQKY